MSREPLSIIIFWYICVIRRWESVFSNRIHLFDTVIFHLLKTWRVLPFSRKLNTTKWRIKFFNLQHSTMEWTLYLVVLLIVRMLRSEERKTRHLKKTVICDCDHNTTACHRSARGADGWLITLKYGVRCPIVNWKLNSSIKLKIVRNLKRQGVPLCDTREKGNIEAVIREIYPLTSDVISVHNIFAGRLRPQHRI